MNLSVVISAYNEENMIEDCIKSVLWVGEVIVVDNQSTDRTVQIAKKYTKKIYSRPNNPMLNVNKNYGFRKAKGKWILSLDADERVTLELKDEIIDKIINCKLKIENCPSGYRISRKNIIFGKEMQGGIWYPDYVIRLFRNGKGKFPEKHNHELLEVKGDVGTLENKLVHYNYSSIDQYLSKLQNQYLDHEVSYFLGNRGKVYWRDAIRFPAEDFLKNFFARGGYKDGLHGLVLAILQAFYMFLVFAKVWEKQKFSKYKSKDFAGEVEAELKKLSKNYKYWFNTVKIIGERNILIKVFLKIKSWIN